MENNIMLNIENFDIKLLTEYIGRNFFCCEEIESTNGYLLNEMEDNLINGTVLFAEKQTKGKGRKDRTWSSIKGMNLTFSVLLTDKRYFKKNVTLINLAVPLSVADAINNLYQLQIDLKWPNDVLINRKKTAGILLESTSKGNNIDKLVIGIGLNVNQTTFQGDFNITPTSLKLELKHNVEREKLLAEILNNLEENLEKLIVKPRTIIEDWKTNCSMIGEKIEISEGDQKLFGIFEDIDENGYLLLKTNNKIEKIQFGDLIL
jgi:BirA family transcriptional regulator, biotin operon repressor / biotin---[acetyl-CoA-carboxylase] ligase